MKRWISLLLIGPLTFALLGGCAKAPAEEDAVSDSWIGVEDNDNQPDKKPDAGKTEEDPDKGGKPDVAPDDAGKTEEDPDTGKPDKTPDTGKPDETPDTGKPDEEPDTGKTEEGTDEPTPITKEESGVPLTIMVQNLRTAGTQNANTQGQRTDTLGRTGQANELYSRARRFRENVKRVDPDVILGCEGTIGWIQWFQSNDYFKKNYDLVYHWADGGKAPVGNDGSKPILYKKARFTLLDQGVFWYSETPTHPSFFTSGEAMKNCTWAKLKEKESGEVFYAYAIHIRNDAHLEDSAGTGWKSLDLLIKTAENLPKGSYAFFGGDYNIRYRDDVYQMCMNFDVMLDLKDQALNMAKDGLSEIGGNSGSVCPEYEREATGGNYGTPKIIAAPRSQLIDHLMAKTNPRMAVDYWGYDYTTTAVPEENVVEGYVSDHYALVVKLRIATDVDYSRYQDPYKE